MGYGEEIPFNYNLPGTFDVGPLGPKVSYVIVAIARIIILCTDMAINRPWTIVHDGAAKFFQGPTIGAVLVKGERKFSPWINDFNWKARVACEVTPAADSCTRSKTAPCFPTPHFFY